MMERCWHLDDVQGTRVRGQGQVERLSLTDHSSVCTVVKYWGILDLWELLHVEGRDIRAIEGMYEGLCSGHDDMLGVTLVQESRQRIGSAYEVDVTSHWSARTWDGVGDGFDGGRIDHVSSRCVETLYGREERDGISKFDAIVGDDTKVYTHSELVRWSGHFRICETYGSDYFEDICREGKSDQNRQEFDDASLSSLSEYCVSMLSIHSCEGGTGCTRRRLGYYMRLGIELVGMRGDVLIRKVCLAGTRYTVRERVWYGIVGIEEIGYGKVIVVVEIGELIK
ncbi:hypothetical protein Tco_1570686 [Tanacetum coccineum]